MTEAEKGEQIIKSVYKAAISALMAIGVKSAVNIERFTQEFSIALDKEFLKIGLMPQTAIPIVSDREKPQEINKKNITDPIDTLGIHHLTLGWLKKAKILTIGDLMTFMQKDSLVTIKGIKEKAAKSILEALKTWNSKS